MKFYPMSENETAKQGYTHRLELSYRDIPAGIANNTSNTTWPIVPKIPTGTIIYDAYLILVTPFADTTDAAFNSDTFSLGDTGSATRYFSAVELNANGTFVSNSFAAAKNQQYTAADTLVITLNSMSAKSISNLKVGQLIVLLRIGNENRAAIIDTSGP